MPKRKAEAAASSTKRTGMRHEANGSDSLAPRLSVSKNKVKGFRFEDLATLMECPTCLKIPYPPVFLCVTGHIICNTCSKKVKSCDLCNESITGARSFFYEGVFAKALFGCKYASQGCTEVISGIELEPHQNNCDFRPILCHTDAACGEIPYGSYVEHFQGIHAGKTITTANRVTIGGGIVAFPYSIFSGMDSNIVAGGNGEVRVVDEVREFFFRYAVRDSNIGLYASVLGGPALASEFSAKISFKNYNDTTVLNKFCANWEGPVQSIHKAPDDILDSGLALIVNLNCVRALGRKMNVELMLLPAVTCQTQSRSIVQTVDDGCSPHDAPQIQRTSNNCPESVLPADESGNTSTTSSSTKNQTPKQKSTEDDRGLGNLKRNVLTQACHTISVGNYKVTSTTPGDLRVTLEETGILFHIPHCVTRTTNIQESKVASHQICTLYANFRPDATILVVVTSQGLGKRIRKRLGINHDGSGQATNGPLVLGPTRLLGFRAYPFSFIDASIIRRIYGQKLVELDNVTCESKLAAWNLDLLTTRSRSMVQLVEDGPSPDAATQAPRAINDCPESVLSADKNGSTSTTSSRLNVVSKASAEKAQRLSPEEVITDIELLIRRNGGHHNLKEKLFITQACHSVSIGNHYTSSSQADLRITITETGILFNVPHCETGNIKKCGIASDQILTVYVNLHADATLLVVVTGSQHAKWLRNQLGILKPKRSDPPAVYYCPLNGGIGQKHLVFRANAFTKIDESIIKRLYGQKLVEWDNELSALFLKKIGHVSES